MTKKGSPNGVVLIAIMMNSAYKNTLKELDGSGYKSEIDLRSIKPANLEPYDYNTAFQTKDGKIVLWEHVSGAFDLPGTKNLPGTMGKEQRRATVYHDAQLEATGKRFPIYCVVESTSKYAPPIIDLP